MAMLDIVHGVAQDSAFLRFAKNSFIDAGRRSCRDDQIGSIEVSGSKRLGSPYRFGRSTDWLKVKNPAAPAVKREAEEDWGSKRKSQ